ncbi:rho guanine nucleotide exchange factor 10-like isoform X2 [Melanaphis sacchari]|uniref:rho guanine nucleotide exchange factor 10-like isoform X2 n=1 Tax=Melanaphis sacchari TaxID=742174 RepID=UPI000DC13B11|nr:rho guanine nucleotide exchange factor 10-like isoform X2 [Melanaphis sacchari]
MASRDKQSQYVDGRRTCPRYSGPASSNGDYAYAYYEHGPHGSKPHSCSKHSYINRYGREENIYEEIGTSKLDEEVRYVHSKHLQVLDELNLSMEAMIMPDNGACLNNNGSSGLNLGTSRDGSPVNLSVDSGVACDASSCGTNSLSRPRKSHFSTKRFWNKMPTLISPSPSKTSLPDESVRWRQNSWDEVTQSTTINERHTPSQKSSSSDRDPELSSEEESNNYDTRNNVSKTLRWTKNPPSPDPPSSPGLLSRWFSLRRCSQYDLDVRPNSKMPLLPEVEEDCFSRRLIPPSLPPAPPDISEQELRRRYIVDDIVRSENSYLATLHRLVNDYKKPLEQSMPSILSQSKISILFHRVPEILQCHTLFRIALAEAVANWDRDHRIGDVFVGSFSKAIVLDIYSGFINNFLNAMELAKTETKRKASLAEFFKNRQEASHDRLSFYSLMVKPVQRFPQFILFLQDLLHNTGYGHPDRMSLQLALTQLESLAEMLNERKRESEQAQAFKEMLKSVSSKLAVRPIADSNRCLLRQDDVTQIEINHGEVIGKCKPRRLLLLNDLLVCVSVNNKDDSNNTSQKRLTFKWSFPIAEIQVIDTLSLPSVSRTIAGSAGSHNSITTDNLCNEMNHLMHDYQVISRIVELASTLKGTYLDLAPDNLKGVLNAIQCEVQYKGDQVAWMDSCCLQLFINRQGYTFQMENPDLRKGWITELRLARLALDPNNSPAWEVPDQELMRPMTKMPLFVGAHPITSSSKQAEVTCGCFYSSGCGKFSYLWVCTTNIPMNTHIAIMSVNNTCILKQITTLDLPQTIVTAIEYVRASDTVWMGTNHKSILIFNTADMSEEASISLPGEDESLRVTAIKHHCDTVFVALSNGSLLLYRRGNQSKEPEIVVLGPDAPITCILPINLSLYVACGKQVFVMSAITGELQKNFTIHHGKNVNLLAHSGVGLWLSLMNSTTVCLYHTETFKHLQDINIASNVIRLKGTATPVNVTALMACKGLLWVGTDAGISLTVPLPRLEGVPIISGKVNVSYHGHTGAISILVPLQDPPTVLKRPPSKTLASDIYDLYGRLMCVKDYDKNEDVLNSSRWSLRSTDESSAVQHARSSDVSKKDFTLVTVSCGRGYVNYQQPCCSTIENNAYIILWEIKL